jgi:hypothetical protein
MTIVLLLEIIFFTATAQTLRHSVSHQRTFCYLSHRLMITVFIR